MEITPADIFSHVDSGGDICTTAAVNIGEYMSCFDELSPAYVAVIVITIGAEFSGCFQNARIASQDYPNVYVVDSRSLSCGQGLLVLKAAELVQKNIGAEFVCEELNEAALHIEASFILDRLDYMKKGGRCTAVTALGENLLKLKPCIEVKSGRMTVGKKYRGSFSKVIYQYAKERLASIILTLLIFLVFREDYREIIENIRSVHVMELLLLFALEIVYLTFDSAVCFVLIHSQLPNFTFRQAMRINYLGVFGNVSTFSVGSIPMQSYYLHSCGMAVGSGIGVMTLEYVLHKSSVLIYATVMLIMQGCWLGAEGANLLFYTILGYIICALIIAILVLLCTWKKLLQLALWVIKHFPDTEKWEKRKQSWSLNLHALYAESQKLLKNPIALSKAFVLNGIKLLCLYAIPFFCIRMLGISDLSFWRVQLLAALMFLISNALPNIAGMGSTEFAFMLLFSRCISYSQASSALILYRTATFFFPFVISIFVFLAVQQQMMSSEKKNR